MRKTILCCVMASVCILSAGCSPESDPSAEAAENESDVVADIAIETDDPQSFFTVDGYDPDRNAVEDLSMTTALAAKSRKRILIEVGGKW